MAAQTDTMPGWLLELLKDGEVYEVGGSVRDRLLGVGVSAVSKDRDFLVRLIPLTELQRRLRRHGKVNLVGKSFGVIKFTPAHAADETPVTHDVALPRRERSTGIGHTDFEVEFDPDLSLAADLGRRDFTINAIARDCATGAIVDPLDGSADLRARVLRMVFPGSFTEDPLRILRGAQFAARFSCTIEPVTWEAMREAVPLIDSVSLERVGEELTKLLTLAPEPSVGIRILQQLGVLERLIPELQNTFGVDQPGGYHAYDVFEHSLRTADAAAPRLRLRWAALLHDVNKPQCRELVEDKATFYGHDRLGSRTARRILTRLRYPNDLAEQVGLLIDKHMFTTAVTDKGVRRLIRKLGPELVYDLLNLRRADVVAQGKGGHTDDVDELEARITAEINSKPPFNRTDLAVDGNDLMTAFGVEPGPGLGRLIDALLEAVLDDPALNTREQLLALTRKLLADKPSN